MLPKESGVACRWNEKGFGFIVPDDGSEELFVHVKENGGDENFANVQAGDAVSQDMWICIRGKPLAEDGPIFVMIVPRGADKEVVREMFEEQMGLSAAALPELRLMIDGAELADTCVAHQSATLDIAHVGWQRPSSSQAPAEAWGARAAALHYG